MRFRQRYYWWARTRVKSWSKPWWTWQRSGSLRTASRSWHPAAPRSWSTVARSTRPPAPRLTPAACDDGTRTLHVHTNPNSDRDSLAGGDARLEQGAVALEPAFASRSGDDGRQRSGGFLG